MTIGIVTNNKDPDGLGRVKASLPWMADQVETDWARVVTPMAGSGRGLYFLPEVNDEVLVAFEHGNPDTPYVLGGLVERQGQATRVQQRRQERPAHDQVAQRNVIRFCDTDGEEKIEIIDSSAKNTIVISTKENSITITATGDVTIQSNNGKLKLNGNSVEITSTTTVKIEASQSMELKSSGQLTVKGQVVNIN